MQDSDRLTLIVLLVTFATLLTTHVGIAMGLARRPPRWRAAVAFIVPPLAPWWGWRVGLRARSVLWMLAATVYALALVRARS